MKSNPVGWFEIPVTDMGRATKFYERVLNTKLTPVVMESLTMAWFPMEPGIEGASGSLIKAETYVPSYNGSMVYFSVDDIEGTLERVKMNGGKIIRGKSSIGEYGFVGHFEDCEGNRVALHSTQ
jgi:predicted enzyme related to lactoylglutathione lyase